MSHVMDLVHSESQSSLMIAGMKEKDMHLLFNIQVLNIPIEHLPYHTSTQ